MLAADGTAIVADYSTNKESSLIHARDDHLLAEVLPYKDAKTYSVNPTRKIPHSSIFTVVSRSRLNLAAMTGRLATGSASWRVAQQAPSTFCVSQSLIRSWKKEESQYPIPRSVQPGSGGPSQPGRRSAASVVISEFVSPVMLLLSRSESCPPSEYIWGLVGVLEYAA